MVSLSTAAPASNHRPGASAARAPGSMASNAGFSGKRRAKPPPALESLRRQIRRLEAASRGPAPRAQPRSLPLGAAALDRALPGGGLPLGCLHEIAGVRGDWDDGAATGFCLALLARLMAARPGAVLWVSPWGDLYPPGLLAHGLDPGRFVFVEAHGEAELLWALEEGLRCGALAAVVGELESLPRRAGRRLQLAAEKSGVTAFVLARGLTAKRGTREPSAAVTRWQLQGLPGGPQDCNGEEIKGRESKRPRARQAWYGQPRWEAALLRCRGAAPGAWPLDWGAGQSGNPFDDRPFDDGASNDKREDHAARGLTVAAALCERAREAGAVARFAV